MSWPLKALGLRESIRKQESAPTQGRLLRLDLALLRAPKADSESPGDGADDKGERHEGYGRAAAPARDGWILS